VARCVLLDLLILVANDSSASSPVSYRSILYTFEGTANEEITAPFYDNEPLTVLTDVMFGIGSA